MQSSRRRMVTLEAFLSRMYPLDYLPTSVRKELARKLDIANSFFELAEILGYSPTDAQLVYNRTAHQREHGGSVTMALLADYATRRHASIQAIQRALQEMQHVAVDIIPDNLHAIESSARAVSIDNSPRIVDENREPSSIPCTCDGCRPRSIYPGHSGPPSYRYSPSPAERVPYTTDRTIHGHMSYEEMVTYQGQTVMHSNTDVPIGVMESSLTSPGSISIDRLSGSGRSSSPPTRNDCTCNSCRVNSSPDETAVMKTFNGPQEECCGATRMSELKSSEAEASQRNSVYNQGRQGRTDRLTSVDGAALTVAPSYHQSDRRSWPNQRHSDPETMSSASSDSVLEILARGEIVGVASEIPFVELTKYSSIATPGARNPSENVENNLNVNIPVSRNISRSTNVTSSPEVVADRGPLSVSLTDKKASAKPRVFQDNTASVNPRANQDKEASVKSRVIKDNNASVNPRVTQSQRVGMPPVSRSSSMGKCMGLVTYSMQGNAPVDEIHLKEVTDLCQTLYHCGIRMKLDMEDNIFRRITENKYDWLDNRIREADFVIVCISPAYHREVTWNDQPGASHAAVSDLNARYIFDRLRSEFRDNGCRNHRVIPVLFPNSGATREHIPDFMRSTLVYSYPAKLREIIKFILTYYGRP